MDITEQQIEKAKRAILNDTYRKQLFKKLFELYSNAMPMVNKNNDGTISCYYSDEVEELANKIREQIALRDNQIFNAQPLIEI